MTRKGKIGRLPRDIREELNRRLDNGEEGKALMAWLNGLPEVRKVLEADFGGQKINKVNLCEWKKGGFLDWRGGQETIALAQEFNAKGKELAAASKGELTESLAAVVSARYAALLQGWNGEMTPELESQLKGLRGLTREVVRLRRSDQLLEQIKIERQWLELEQQKTDEGIRKKFEQWASEQDFHEKITPKMTKEEKNKIIRQILLGTDQQTEGKQTGPAEQ